MTNYRNEIGNAIKSGLVLRIECNENQIRSAKLNESKELKAKTVHYAEAETLPEVIQRLGEFYHQGIPFTQEPGYSGIKRGSLESADAIDTWIMTQNSIEGINDQNLGRIVLTANNGIDGDPIRFGCMNLFQGAYVMLEQGLAKYIHDTANGD